MGLPAINKCVMGRQPRADGLVAVLDIPTSHIRSRPVEVFVQMFHLGKVIRSRKVVRDVTYKWIPFLFVVLTVIVCTALLSTSGKPPRGIVVTFSVLAGLLVFFFLSCHLMVYCTGAKHDMDMEMEMANSDNGDNSNTNPIPHPDGNLPPGSVPNASANAQAQERRRDRTENRGLGRNEQQQHGQYNTNRRTDHHYPTSSPAAQHHIHRPKQAVDYGSEQPPPPSRIENEVPLYSRLPTSDRRSSGIGLRRSSAAPDPLRTKRGRLQADTNQEQPLPDSGLEALPSDRTRSRYTSGGYGSGLHSAKTKSYTEAAGPSPQEPAQRDRADSRDAPVRQILQRDLQGSQPHGSNNVAIQREEELFLPDTSAPSHTCGGRFEDRGYPAEEPGSVRAHYAVLGGPNAWDLASHLFSDAKPLAPLRRVSSDDYLDRTLSTLDDDDTVVRLRDTERKAVQVHTAGPEVERVRSHKVLVQRSRLRDSNDSGYYSADSVQSAAASLPQPPGPSTAGSSTLVTPAAASSADSTWTPPSTGPSVSSSPSSISERQSLHRRSVSTMGSIWVSWSERASTEDDGAMRRSLHERRPVPLGRSNTY